ncbi:peptidoglycan-binding domain-containing protein [Abyssalbus ytuae]|uniref:Peptidoglycan-binding protein n=1 Tax=Abyssalbus ytuae TaxID=2926907 RepID=A0A9E7D1F2_9FLAO|nr:peptidoglycan-binding domain-containing protein [Abyssalbus ytuae]UOB19270.1 peptidoglycan-binding protein [Abyssalbus ytuae]
MKQIIIFLLVVIISIMGYNLYKKHKRFTPPEYEYKISEKIDLNYFNQTFLLHYYQQVEKLNGYVITQWANNGIDVRNPGNDDETIKSAVNEYASLLGKVKFYEEKLIQSSNLKKEGLNNDNIRIMEEQGISPENYKKKQETQNNILSSTILKELFKNNNNNKNIGLGAQGPMVFELQKILVKKGYEMPIDGIYKAATYEAVKAFEEKNSLYPDGRLDILTLEHLLK